MKENALLIVVVGPAPEMGEKGVRSKSVTREYRDNYDTIFGRKEEKATNLKYYN